MAFLATVAILVTNDNLAVPERVITLWKKSDRFSPKLFGYVDKWITCQKSRLSSLSESSGRENMVVYHTIKWVLGFRLFSTSLLMQSERVLRLTEELNCHVTSHLSLTPHHRAQRIYGQNPQKLIPISFFGPKIC